MPKKGKPGGKGKKVRLTLIKNGDPRCTHLINVVPSVKTILDEAGKHLKGIAQTGERCLFATDGYPLGDDDLKHAQTGDIVVVSSGEVFRRLEKNTEVGRAKLKTQGGKVYSQDAGYATREPLGIKSRPEGWNPTAVAQISSVASAFGATQENPKVQLRWQQEDHEEKVLTLESKKVEDMSDWFGCLKIAIDRVQPNATGCPSFRGKSGWLKKRLDKGSDKRWFVLGEESLAYYKKEEDVKAGKTARGTFKLADLQIIDHIVPVAEEPPEPEADLSFMSLKGLKKGQTMVLSDAATLPAERDKEEWQRTPKQLLEAHCRFQRKSKAVYRHKKVSKEERKNQTEFQCDVIFRDSKGRKDKDIAFKGLTRDSKLSAEHDAALVSLRLYEPTMPHERKLPEPYKTRWLELLDGPEPVPVPAHKVEVAAPTAPSRDRTVNVQSEFQLVVVGDGTRKQVDSVLKQCFVARNEQFDVSKVVTAATGSATAAHEEREKRLASLQNETKTANERDAATDFGLPSEALGWLDELAQAPVDPEQATSAAIATPDVAASYNAARAFLWPDEQVESHLLPPMIEATTKEDGEEEEEEDWETELQAADREEEFKAFESHYNENSVRCSFGSCDDAAVCSLRLLLPSLGFAVLQFWVAAASDYPESPPICLILGGPFTPDLRMRIMRNIGRRLGTMVGASMLRPLVDCLSEDDGWLLAKQWRMEAEPEPEPKAEAELQPEPQPGSDLEPKAEPTSEIEPGPKSEPEASPMPDESQLGVSSESKLVGNDEAEDTETLELEERPEQLKGAMFELPPDELMEHKDAFADSGGGVPSLFTDEQLQQFGNSSKLQARQKLPAAKEKQNFLSTLFKSQCIVVTGETGCGKTTQVPQFILEELCGECFIVCTQPRRLSAIAVASRVADERNEHIDGRECTVGYSVRGESRRTSECRLLFCTTGVLLRRMQQEDMLLEGARSTAKVTHVIVDEVHERSVDSDHLVCLLRDVMEQRKDLKVILMSATINAARFSAYFNDCPTLHIPGFTHPVQQYYLEDCLSMVTKTGFFVRGKHEGATGDDALTTKDYQQLSEDGYDEATIRGLKAMEGRDKIEKGLVARVVLHLAMQLLEQSEAEDDGDVTGAILVFLPGMGTISSIHDSLVFGRGLKMEEASVAQEILWVLPLHSAMSPADQQKVFQRPPCGMVKVVLSTNICETSITIDDVVCVVDSARVNETGYDVKTGTSYLREEWCTKAARRQRSGRAGRVRPGECWSLITRKKANMAPPFPAPEIERVSIDQLYLRIESSMANNTSDKFVVSSTKGLLQRFLDPPTSTAIDDAVERLIEIGAITKLRLELTPLGQHLSFVPIELRLAKILLFGTIFGCVDPITTIVACLGGGRSVFTIPVGMKEKAAEAHAQFAVKGSDLLTLLRVYDAWANIRDVRTRREWCRTNFLSDSALLAIATLRNQLLNCLVELKFLSPGSLHHRAAANRYASSTRVLKAVVCAGLYPRVVKIKLPQRKYIETSAGAMEDLGKVEQTKYLLQSGERVFLHPSSVMVKEAPEANMNLFLLYYEKVETSKVYLRDATDISPLALLMFGGELMLNEEKRQISIDKWIVFDAPPTDARLLVALRRELDRIINNKMVAPPTAIEKHDVIEAVASTFDPAAVA